MDKVLMISLGCDKNLVDSEEMLSSLVKGGYEMTDLEEEADVIIVNSCCFISDAKEESINTIIEMGQLKVEGKLKALVVTGCLGKRYEKEIREQIPEVDAVLGTESYDQILQTVDRILGRDRLEDGSGYLPERDRILLTTGHYAFLKIAEGCNKNCTYCTIPKVRGSYRSFPIEELVREAERLASRGVKELVLVAQETTLYGIDLYGRKSLPELLKKLCRVDGIHWIRIMYCYPEEITDELIQTIKEEPKVCHYLDIPIQHCNDDVLKRMGRRTRKAELLDTINKLREEIPDIALRTTLISGFPGESREAHEELYNFVNEVEFDRLGVFTYSPEEGTLAEQMEDQIEESLKEERRDELMLLQQQISADKSQEYIDKIMEVIVEGELPEEGVYVGRTYRDAADVDGYVFFHAMRELMSGEFVKVEITDSSEYDLKGVMIDE